MKMEETAWNVAIISTDDDRGCKKKKIAFANKEALEELHCDHSFKSIHKKKGTSAESSDGDMKNTGSRENPMDVDGDEKVGDKKYENLLPAELLAMLKQHKVGSPPNSERSETGSGVKGNESSLVGIVGITSRR